MLWSLMLPLQITFFSWMAIIGLVWWLAPKYGKKRIRYVPLSMCLAFVLFLPSIQVVFAVVHHFRFDIFHFSDFSAINDWRVERYLPEAATDITLEKPAHSNGFRAKYSISKAELEEWLYDLWIQWKERARETREEGTRIRLFSKI